MRARRARVFREFSPSCFSQTPIADKPTQMRVKKGLGDKGQMATLLDAFAPSWGCCSREGRVYWIS